MEMVTCQICKCKMKMVTPSHLAKHSVTISNYIKKFPASELRTTEFKINHSLKLKKLNLSPWNLGKRMGVEVRKKISISLSGRRRTLISRQRQSDSLLGHVGYWKNRKFTKNHRMKIAKARSKQNFSWSNTKPERLIKQQLLDKGIRFKSQKFLKGFPHAFDFYLLKSKTIIEADGCYFHGCSKCGKQGLPEKVERDVEINAWATKNKFPMIRIKECDIKDPGFDINQHIPEGGY